MRRPILILSILIVFGFETKAQSVPVVVSVFDDYYRREQLLGKVDSNFSFTVRPIFPGDKQKLHDVYDVDNSLKKNHWISAGPVSFAKGLGSFQILPFNWQQQYNSNNPYGWNDGAMIPARGYQTMISGGFYLKFGPLSIQLRPEFVYASNREFDGFNQSHTLKDIENYYGTYYNSTDVPEQYGNGPYNKLFAGQSSIRLTVGPISAGLSNENLWWGPGINNALILSNNAPGFNHITLNTVRPVKTYIGHFEGQIIAAHLNSSGTRLLLTTGPTKVFTNRENNTRYFTGFNINYHPKWVSGLTLGLTRTFDAYAKDVNRFQDYVPFFTAYSKEATTGQEDDGTGDPFARDQYTSVYARWLFTKAQAEVYFEYGLNDNAYNLKDFIGSPEHSRTYLFGARKMIPLNKNNQHILFSAEVTQLSQTVDRLVRNSGGWYVHGGVKEGHTNQGQILGAGIGTSGNIQSIDISWVSGLKKLGIQFDRYEHNVDFQQGYLSDINGNSRKWVDFAVALNGTWSYKNLIFNAKLQHIKSLNYLWILKDYTPTNSYYIPHNDVYNFHGELGMTFRF